MAQQNFEGHRSELPEPEIGALDNSRALNVDSTLPLPTFHPNSQGRPTGSEGRPNTYETPRSVQRQSPNRNGRPKDIEVNSCLLCLGSAWDSLANVCGRHSLLIWILSFLGMLLLLACIPFFIILLNNPPGNDASSMTLRSNDLNDTRSLNLMDLFIPEDIGVCKDYGFNCNVDPNEFVGITQRCDGILDCSDGSDEENCVQCHSGFSCPSKINPNNVICLRGNKICDGIKHCDDGSDETLFCGRTECTEDEFYCRSSNTCVPKSYQCDGDAQCPSGEDELECSTCNNGAIFCPSTNKCIPKWNICDGTAHCPDKSDESNCGCTTCSGNNRVMCKKSNFCITRDAICDGISNCPDGEDEEGCPGTCDAPTDMDDSKSTLVKSFLANDFLTCNDGKRYIRTYACSGLLSQCEGVCDNGCDHELSFTCDNGACISRSSRCDGIKHCVDGSDEEKCEDECNTETHYQCRSNSITNVKKCIDNKYKCDGVRDCPLGDDETDCDKCTSPEALYCLPTRSCHPSIARCDGVSQCPDESDELECSCAECSLHPYKMYTCSTGNRCFRRENVCDPYSQCPNANNIDINYCLNPSNLRALFYNEF
uniref:EGF-like domain-containing protein n=1 Tax=Parastrongyloides trichosuri TaxID=131310 RepID=A0A0N4ZG03_PARTI